MPAPPVHEFGPFRYDPVERQLLRDGQPVPLVPKAIDTLHVLLERRGQIIGKAELLRLVWPDTTVEEIGLARNISILRKALGDEGDSPRYIETIPRRGYRFRAEPAPATPPLPKPRWPWIAAALLVLALLIWWQFYLPSRYLPPGERVAQLAVLPFQPLDPGIPPALPAALNELIVAELARSGGLRVVSPSTVARYQRFAIPSSIMTRVLGLDVILEGAIQQTPATLRITARLADVHSGRLIWAETFESPAADPAAAQQEAARAIAARLRTHLILAKP